MQSSDANGPSDAFFRVCSTCKKPLPFGERYYRCSVSTCNRPRTGLYFCSVPCWDAHVPEARHRDAWAEETRAPTRAEWQAQQVEAQADAERQREAQRPRDAERQRNEAPMTEKSPTERRIVAPPAATGEAEREILVVVSKLKAYIKARSGFNTSDSVSEALSDHLRRLCDRAIENAGADSRKTVLDRDFKPLFKLLP